MVLQEIKERILIAIIKVVTFVRAPIDVCFDTARDIEIHTNTVWKHTREKAIKGVTKGLIGFNETVTFEATHFGVRQTLTSKIVEFDRPYRFIDQMQKGAFNNMRHVHEFREKYDGTLMVDILDFSSPFGMIGKSFDSLVLKPYMKRFLEDRNKRIKSILEEEKG